MVTGIIIFETKEAARWGSPGRFHFRQQARPLGQEEAHGRQNVRSVGAFQLLKLSRS